jgi:hypothetical protein
MGKEGADFDGIIPLTTLWFQTVVTLPVTYPFKLAPSQYYNELSTSTQQKGGFGKPPYQA